MVLPRLERALEIAICAGLTRLEQSDACDDSAGSGADRAVDERRRADGTGQSFADRGLRRQDRSSFGQSPTISLTGAL